MFRTRGAYNISVSDNISVSADINDNVSVRVNADICDNVSADNAVVVQCGVQALRVSRRLCRHANVCPGGGRACRWDRAGLG